MSKDEVAAVLRERLPRSGLLLATMLLLLE